MALEADETLDITNPVLSGSIPGIADASPEEAACKTEEFKTLRRVSFDLIQLYAHDTNILLQKLVNWFHHHCKKYSDHCLKQEHEKLALLILKQHCNSIHCLSEANWYTKQYPEWFSRNLDEQWAAAQKEWAEKVTRGAVGSNEKPPQRVSLQTKVAKEVLKKETAEFRKSLEAEIEDDYQARKAEAEKVYEALQCGMDEEFDR